MPSYQLTINKQNSSQCFPKTWPKYKDGKHLNRPHQNTSCVGVHGLATLINCIDERTNNMSGNSKLASYSTTLHSTLHSTTLVFESCLPLSHCQKSYPVGPRLIQLSHFMNFAKFCNFREKIFKPANSQMINFLEKSCNGLSVKIRFLLTQGLQQNSLKLYKYFKQAVQTKVRLK